MPTMESSYGVVVGNRFGALTEDFDDDPLEQIKALEEAARKKKAKKEEAKESKTTPKKEKEKPVKSNKDTETSKTAKSDTPAPTKAVEKSVSTVDQPTQVINEAATRKAAPRSDRGPRPQKDNREEPEKKPPQRKPPQTRDFEKSPEVTVRQETVRNETKPPATNRSENLNQGSAPVGGTGFGGPGRPPRGRGNRGAVRGGKRNFDRHSGSDKTGIKAVDKREGGGARNWGNVKDDLEDQLSQPEAGVANTSVIADETENQDPNPEAPNADVKDQSAPDKAAPEKAQMTLDEWKAMQSKEIVQPTYDVRKPDEEQWERGYYALPKKNQLDKISHSENKADVHKGRHKEVLDIDFHFNQPPQRGQRIRRGNRGGRGGRVGFYRGGLRHNPAPQIDDQMDFPSLQS